MDIEKLGEIIGISATTGAPITPEQVQSVLTDGELLQAVQKRGLILSGTTVVESVQTPEPLTPKILLGTLDAALTTYAGFVDTVNTARVGTKSRKKSARLELINTDIIRADVEVLLANEAVISELQAEIDYFTTNPETGSPAPNFDIVVIPEGLTTSDIQILASNVQSRITDRYEPYIRSEACINQHTPEVTSKGYHLAFAPRHCNIPKGTADNQKNWMHDNNRRTEVTQLQTATAAAALAAITSLVMQGKISTNTNYDESRFFHASYWRHFDQAPLGGRVPYVFVSDVGGLFLGASDARDDLPTRALVVLA